MIAKLNLASDPFRNRTLPWAAAVFVAAVSLLALVLILADYRRASAEAATAASQVEELRKQRGELEQQAAEIRQNIPPEQRYALEAAHALVERKRFSWTQLFSDLEGALPTGVRVSRINVREVSEFGELTRADLDLTVVGRSPTAVTGMIAEMSRGGTFSAVPLTENQRAGRGESGYEWTLRVSYVQRARASGAGGSPAPEESTGARAGTNSRESESEDGGRD